MNSWDTIVGQLKKSKTIFNYLTIDQVEDLAKAMKIIKDNMPIDDRDEWVDRLFILEAKNKVLTYLVIALLEMKDAEYNE